MLPWSLHCFLNLFTTLGGRAAGRDKSNDIPDPWLMNFSNVDLSETVSDIIRLVDKFSSSSLSSKNEHIFEIIKDLETNIHKIPEQERILDFDRLLAKNIK